MNMKVGFFTKLSGMAMVLNCLLRTLNRHLSRIISRN